MKIFSMADVFLNGICGTTGMGRFPVFGPWPVLSRESNFISFPSCFNFFFVVVACHFPR